jgi:hypothetical protein
LRKIIAVYSVFNVQELIAESIRSVAWFVDEIHVYDGRYEGFKCPCGKDHDNSCDSTANVIDKVHKDMSCSIKYVALPTMPELEKRTKTFDGLGYHDVALIIDDDELFYGFPIGLHKFRQNSNSTVAWLRVLGIRHSLYPSMRVIKKTSGLKYVAGSGLSYEIHDNNGPLKESYSAAQGIPYKKILVLEDCRLVHLFGEGITLGYRPLERDRARVEYDSHFMKTGLK